MNEYRESGEKAASPLFHCSQCPRAYKRAEHLQRHSSVHRSVRDYGCPRCGSTFQRSDVLHRHLKTCDGRKSRRASLTRRACDACVKSKRACSSNLPCTSCRRRSIPCTFTSSKLTGAVHPAVTDEKLPLTLIPTANTDSDVSGLGLLDDETWSLFLNASLPDFTAEDFDWTLLASGQQTEERSLRFLESFTRNTGFLDSFDCLTVEERTAAYKAFTGRPSSAPTVGNDLLLKSHEIVALIKEAVEVKPRNNPVKLVWSQILQTMCVDFFSPQRICLWLDLYWAIWHPNVNYMHRPTFDARTSKAPLLAAMCIVGALVSPNESDRENAQLWMDSVEEMVFRDDEVTYDGQRSSAFPSPGRLQAIQAMYMVCLFQNWEGDEAGKSRIRRFRYGTVVAVARDIGIQHARHPQYHSLQLSTFSWNAFVAREELLRVFMWVFLLDTAFVIFNNVPPRMSTKEMKMHLACNEASFQAQTGELCFRSLQSDGFHQRHLLSSVTAMLCKGPIGTETQSLLADTGPLNMFALTSGCQYQSTKSINLLTVAALHSIIFQAQQLFGFETELGPVRIALDNWNAIWQIYRISYAMTTKHCPLMDGQLVPDNMWQRIGFMRFASEYWLLAKLLVERIIQRTYQNDLGSTTDHIAAASEEIDGSSSTVLEKYDETSMRQVNALIADFQKIVL